MYFVYKSKRIDFALFSFKAKNEMLKMLKNAWLCFLKVGELKTHSVETLV